MSEVTRILSAIEQGDPLAAEQLLPLVYDELRQLAAQRLAQEKPGQTLQATALVHEAYLRLVNVEQAQRWNSRGHFFAAAAEAMRRILIENARRKLADKRCGQRTRVSLDHVDAATVAPPDELLALDEALERLERHDPIAGQLVKFRYFAGLSLEQAAEVLGISSATAYRHWSFGRAWLHIATQQYVFAQKACKQKWGQTSPGGANSLAANGHSNNQSEDSGLVCQAHRGAAR
jgi:RNA polymerase sigma factor (TIGR02999 family)